MYLTSSQESQGEIWVNHQTVTTAIGPIQVGLTPHAQVYLSVDEARQLVAKLDHAIVATILGDERAAELAAEAEAAQDRAAYASAYDWESAEVSEA